MSHESEPLLNIEIQQWHLFIYELCSLQPIRMDYSFLNDEIVMILLQIKWAT